VDFHRCIAGSGIAQWISKRPDSVGCHDTCLTGEWCIRTATTEPVCNDRIQTVVGMESLLVANRSPSLLKARIEIPWTGWSAFVREVDVGGFAGCGAMI